VANDVASPHRSLVAAVVALSLAGCGHLNPAVQYREAARQLRFSLDRVEPHLELAFPLEQSRLKLNVAIGVENPSDLGLRARGLEGVLKLDAQGAEHTLGIIALPEGVSLPSRGRSTLKMEMRFGYADIKASWPVLSAVVFRQEPATWLLDGQAQLDYLGVAVTVPVHVTRDSGR